MIFNFLREELPTALLSCYLRESGEVAGQKRTMLSAAELPSGGGGIIGQHVHPGLPASAPSGKEKLYHQVVQNTLQSLVNFTV